MSAMSAAVAVAPLLTMEQKPKPEPTPVWILFTVHRPGFKLSSDGLLHQHEIRAVHHFIDALLTW